MLVKCIQLTISKVIVLRKCPLPSTVVVAEVVFSSWEIDPLWMSKLVAHKIEISFASKTLYYQPDHFVESYTPINFKVFAISVHRCVNFFLE